MLDLWGIGFHAVVVFGPGKDYLFKTILGRCDWNWNQLKTSKPNPSYFSWCSTAARRRRHYETDGMNLHKVDVI